MAKNGRKIGSIDNTLGNLMGMGDGRGAYRSQVNSTKGYYYVEFSKKYRGVSELDIELKEVYTIDLISAHIGAHKDFIRLKPKKENLTETSVDSVFYVKRGTAVIGKVSISVRRYGDTNELLIIYQQKYLRPKYQLGRTKQSDATSRSKAKSNKRKSNRTKKTQEKSTT